MKCHNKIACASLEILLNEMSLKIACVSLEILLNEMSLKIACVPLEISLNVMSLKIAYVSLEISLNEMSVKIACVSLGADRIFWSLSGGREGAQSGARQNIQKLQEVNGEADLLGRPFVRTSSTCTCHSTFCSLSLYLDFLLPGSFRLCVSVCHLTRRGGEIAESVNLSEYSTGRK